MSRKEVWGQKRRMLLGMMAAAARRVRFAVGRRRRQCCAHIIESSRAMTTIMGSTEDEFLSLGSSLQDYYSRCGRLSELVAGTAQEMSGETIGSAIQEFQAIADRIKSQEQVSAQSIARLVSVLDMIRDLQTPLASFGQTVKTLNVLAVYTRIENAQLSSMETGFDTLADNINTMAVDIRTKADDIAARTRALCPMIEQAIEKIRHLQEVQHKKVESILDETTAGLAALTEKNRASVDCTRHMADQYQAITRNIGEIVSSMQFHDITRQQFEHVQEALGQAQQSLQEGAPRAMFAQANGAAQSNRDIAMILHVQSAQLQHAADSITDAVAGIVENLSSVRKHIQGMCTEIRQTIAADDPEGGSFLSVMKDGIASITQTLHDYEQARSDVSSAMDFVAETVQDVSGFIRDIQLIGVMVERVALNAQIQAAHIGRDGAALGELAEAIQVLSSETKKITAAVAERFSCIATEAETLHVDEQGETDSGMTAETMIGELSALMDGVDQLNRQLERRVKQVADDGQQLADDIEVATQSISVHTTIADGAARTRRFLGDALEALGTDGSDPGAAHGGQRELQDLASRYTMESERTIHRSVAGLDELEQTAPENGQEKSAADLPVESGPQEQQSEQDELGDNVELF